MVPVTLINTWLLHRLYATFGYTCSVAVIGTVNRIQISSYVAKFTSTLALTEQFLIQKMCSLFIKSLECAVDKIYNVY